MLVRSVAARLSLARACSSRTQQLRGADALLTPKQRQARGDLAGGADAATLRIQKAQLERRRKLSELYDVDAAPSGGAITGAHLDAKLAAAERAGAFENLSGAGKPLPERLRTHFGDEDAADRMMMRLMAENNVKPESMEISALYRPRLKLFRTRLRQLPPPRVGTAVEDASVRAALAHEMAELQKLHAAHKTAAVKDSLTYNLPISVLPKLASTLEEEFDNAHRDA